MAREDIVRLVVTDGDGSVLDSIEIEADEFRRAQDSAAGALSLLNDLSIGADPVWARSLLDEEMDGQ